MRHSLEVTRTEETKPFARTRSARRLPPAREHLPQSMGQPSAAGAIDWSRTECRSASFRARIRKAAEAKRTREDKGGKWRPGWKASNQPGEWPAAWPHGWQSR